jgi:hypothetical protein
LETSDGKAFPLKPRKIDVETLESSRKKIPFHDMTTFGPWLQHYHSEPAPAQLLPGLRIVASDANAKMRLNIMAFFVDALKASPVAANELLQKLPEEARAVRIYSIPLLSVAGYNTGALLSGLKEEERTILNAFRLPDAFDLTPDKMLPTRMDMLWAHFFATGDIEPVRTVASMLAWRADYDSFIEIKTLAQKPTEPTESIIRGVVYSAAGWSLNALSRKDGAVADYIDTLRSSPDTSESVKAELSHVHTNPAFTRQQ